MLSSADAALVDRDPALVGFALLLDEQALADRLDAPVRRRYLRYKAGTSCVLALDVAGESCFAVAYAAHTGGKLDKSVAAAPDGSLLLVDAGLGLLVARPAADRDLPALERLGLDLPAALARALPGRDLRAASLHQLSHKPQRRWVGRLDVPGDAPVVLRVHRPDDARKTVRAVRVLDGHTAWTPSLLGSDRRLGVVAVTWLPGTGLHELLARGTARTDHVRAAGAALAELHGGPLDGLAVRSAEDDVADAMRAAGAAAPAAGRSQCRPGRPAGRAVPRGTGAAGRGARRPVRRPGGGHRGRAHRPGRPGRRHRRGAVLRPGQRARRAARGGSPGHRTAGRRRPGRRAARRLRTTGRRAPPAGARLGRAPTPRRRAVPVVQPGMGERDRAAARPR